MSCLDVIKQEKIIPVIKIDDKEDTIPLLNALSSGGINIGEITFRTDAAAEAIAIAKAHCKNVLIGAGTVICAKQAEAAVNAGAEFIVSPGFSEEVAVYCRKNKILYIPGCITPTEIMAAIAEGIKIIKFFPAESYGGIKTLKALAAAFPAVKFIPTGGINKDNIREYLKEEIIVACGGSWMVKDNLIKNKEFAKIATLSREAKEAVK